MVESPSSGARKQVMVSEPRKGLSAWISTDHELGQLITAFSLNCLKKKIWKLCPQKGQKLAMATNQKGL